MALTVQNLKDRLWPYLTYRLPKDAIDLLADSDFLRIYNQVTRDLNAKAKIRIEKFDKKANSTNAEDDNYTNFLVQGVIQKIYSLFVETANWQNIKYSYDGDRLIFTTMTEGAEIKMVYLRQTEDVANDSDEIDLPDEIVDDLEQLIKIKIMVDYGEESKTSYENALIYYANKAAEKLNRTELERGDVRKHELLINYDDDIYDITDQYIGLENFIVGTDGNYTYVDSE